MTKSIKSQSASRPPVDALQYEKLALSAFDFCDRQLSQLNTLITLASSICRNPPITNDERRRRQTMLELLVDTAEQYQQDLENDRELFQVIALDAKGVSQTRLTASHATRLLAEASKLASGSQPTNNTAKRKRTPAKTASIVKTRTQQSVAVRH
jgi:hypothetical protein